MKALNFRLCMSFVVLILTLTACNMKPPANYREAFDTSEHWSASTDAVAEVGVFENAMRIHVFAAGQSAWSMHDTEYKNLTIEVDTHVLDGPMDNEYGVLVHMQDEQAFLAFSLSADGYVRAAKYQDNGWQVIGADWTPIDVIQQGLADNHVSVTANEGHYSFIVNDTLVLEIDDSSFRKGAIGLYAGSLTEGGVVVAFDNLEITVIE